MRNFCVFFGKVWITSVILFIIVKRYKILQPNCANMVLFFSNKKKWKEKEEIGISICCHITTVHNLRQFVVKFDHYFYPLNMFGCWFLQSIFLLFSIAHSLSLSHSRSLSVQYFFNLSQNRVHTCSKQSRYNNIALSAPTWVCICT